MHGSDQSATSVILCSPRLVLFCSWCSAVQDADHVVIDLSKWASMKFTTCECTSFSITHVYFASPAHHLSLNRTAFLCLIIPIYTRKTAPSMKVFLATPTVAMVAKKLSRTNAGTPVSTTPRITLLARRELTTGLRVRS